MIVRELAAAEDGAWRISVVDVDSDGPLPASPGLHRLVTVVEGPVLDLSVDGEPHALEPRRPFDLPGDATVVASVPEGAVRALVAAVDPALVRPIVTVLELGRTSSLPLAADQAAYPLTGPDAGSLALGPGEVSGRCTVAVLTLEPI